MSESKIDRRWVAWLKRYSPFGFGTLKEFPCPTWAVVFAILFFGMIWRGYERHVDTARVLHGAVSCFTYRIRVQKEPLPEVLVLGSSMNGRGIVREDLEKKLKRPVAKSTISACWLWEAHQILKKYPNETKKVKLVCIDFPAYRLNFPVHMRKFQNGNTFHSLKSVTDMSATNLSFMYKLSNHLKDKPFENQSPIFLPMKLSIRQIAQFSNEPPVDFHEDQWDTRLKMTSKKMLADWKKVQSRSTEPESHLKNYADEAELAIWDFVAYCQSRNIFVVFNIPPTWYKSPAFKPEGKTLTEADQRFLVLCQALEQTPNCAVVYLKNFREIAPRVDERYLMYDTMHMTKKGATIHTNWLAEQMRKDPKIAAALKAPRKREEFFVKKYAKQTWQTVAGYFKPSPPEHNIPDDQPIRVAEQPESVRR